MVRLLTQNLICCPSKSCAYPNNFPLTFRDVETVQVIEAEFNEEFLRGYLGRIEWNALRKSAAEVSPRPRPTPSITALPHTMGIGVIRGCTQ